MCPCIAFLRTFFWLFSCLVYSRVPKPMEWCCPKLSLCTSISKQDNPTDVIISPADLDNTSLRFFSQLIQDDIKLTVKPAHYPMSATWDLNFKLFEILCTPIVKTSRVMYMYCLLNISGLFSRLLFYGCWDKNSFFLALYNKFFIS